MGSGGRRGGGRDGRGGGGGGGGGGGDVSGSENDRLVQMAETVEQAVLWINRLRRDVTGVRMEFHVLKNGLQVSQMD